MAKYQKILPSLQTLHVSHWTSHTLDEHGGRRAEQDNSCCLLRGVQLLGRIWAKEREILNKGI